MNICFITSQHVSELRGGVERVTSILATEFNAKGYNVFMISSLPPIDGDQLLENQFVLPNDTTNSKENQCFLATFVVNHKIDIIINQSEVKANLELIKASTPNIPVISVIHTDPTAAIKAILDNWDYWKIQYGTLKFSLLSPYFYIRKLYQTYTRKKYIKAKHLYYYNQSNAVVLLSEKFINSFINLTEIKDISKLYAISNPQSITRIQNIETKKENIVLFVGRLVYQKRLDRLFRIWKKIKDKKDWKLIIVGDGPDRDLYESLCKKWHIEKVEFVGQCDPTPFYQKAKILCMTSSHEGYGLVITEALQYSVIPIVFESFESITDTIINNKSGFLIKPFNLKKYSVTLEKLISDTEYQESIRRSIHSNNIKRALDSGIIVKKWEHLFHKLHKH